MRVVFWIVWTAGMALLAASFCGALHPLGDSLAVFRLHLGLFVAALSLPALRLRLRLGMTGLGAAGVALMSVLVPTFHASAGPAGTLTLYQKNLLYRPRDVAPLIADIRAADPDAVTFQEVTTGNAAVLVALTERLPTRLICPFARVGAVAVASRWPETGDARLCLERQGLAAIRVRTPQGPVWLVSLHLHWPWPHGQAAQRERLLPVLETLEPPVLIGGDFNMVPWSHGLGAIAQATDTHRIGRAFNTMTRFPLVPLPIDHVLIPAGGMGTTERRPLLGSDHHGLLARVGLPPK